MLKKTRTKMKESNLFKFHFFLIASAFFCISSYSIGYAYFSETLNTRGSINVVVEESEIEVTSISSATLIKDATEKSSPTSSANTATFKVQLSKTNSQLEYTITIKNNGKTNAKYDTTNITTNNEAITYELIDIDSYTIIEPGETHTFKILIEYTSEYHYSYPSSKTATFTLEFLFKSTMSNKYQNLSGYISEDTADVTTTEHGAPITILVQNNNDYPLTFELVAQNEFSITNCNGIPQNYSIQSNSSVIIQACIKDQDSSTAIGTNPTISIMAKTTEGIFSRNDFIDTIELSLETKGKYQLLSSGFTEISTDTDFSKTSTSTGGIYSEIGENGKTTYFYRGKVSDNYFSFAGFTWRILRIDEFGNIKLILNDLITSGTSVATKKFKSSNSATSLEAAKTLAKLIIDPSSSSDNSPVYGYLTDTTETTLRGWYNNNIANTDYEKYIVDTTFCMDTEGGNATSSGTSTTVYYFAPYQKNGTDTALYDPSFTCPSDNTITEKIGLITADEYVYAGGAFNVSNNKFFLNDSSISTNWWTMSPAYYDPTQSTVGVFVVLSDGSLTDWANNSTLKNSYGLRPVITVNGNYSITGSGTQSSPYTFE